MKNTSQEPVHAKGEWNVIISRHKKFKYTGSENDFTWSNWSDYIAISDEELCSMSPEVSLGNIEMITICRDISEATAQRIVKAVNMHDELIKVLQDWTNECVSNVSGFTTIDAKRKSERKVIERALSLLKQAEQK